jgi:hypothetical protein
MRINQDFPLNRLRMWFATFAGILVFVFISVAVVGVTPAFAESSWWRLTSGSQPTNLPSSGEGTIYVMASNLGDAPIYSETSPITLTDTLPAGLTVTEVLAPVGEVGFRGHMTCSTSSSKVTCTYADGIAPYEELEVRIKVKVEGAHSGEVNEAKITGSGTPAASVKRPLVVGGPPVSFGVERYEVSSESASGMPETQAGSHPFQLTTSFMLNENVKPACHQQQGAVLIEACLEPPGLPKDLRFNLPAGAVGDPTAIAQCGEKQFTVLESYEVNQCPVDTVVGVAAVSLEVQPLGYITILAPIFNLTPSPGEPARFGFKVVGTPVTMDTSVRTGRDYGVVVSVNNISELPDFVGAQATFWGVPGDTRHDNSRGWHCVGNYGPGCSPQDQQKPPAFLTLPTSCSSSLLAPMEADSWKEPSNPVHVEPSAPLVSLDGCDRLPFSAGIEVAPDLQQASTPTGLKVDVHVPQDATLNTNGVAGADVKDISVTLPEGVTLNPAGSDGLEACSDSEIGFEGVDPTGLDLFSSGLPAPKGMSPLPFCPDAAKIATARITTPLLPHAIEGAVYLAAQNENPFGSLVAMYLVAEDPISGILVKLPGEVSLNGVSGQITATFKNSPQVPFEDAELHFFGGDRAPLSTPALCGSYTTQATLTPWSGNAPVNTSSTFKILTGPNGGPCPNPAGEQSLSALPFAPALTAGTTSNQAGGFSPFTMTMSREDGNQNLQAVVLHMPPGLLGTVSTVTPCGEAQANAGTCGTESLIGETIVSVGLGSNPYTVTGGKVYLTGPYDGAPYGLSIVNPANAGPFHLGNVIVRAKIEVDPLTANLTVTTNKTGPGSIPQMIDGIPLQIKHINVTIGRPGFIFNPTDCEKLELTGSLTSSFETNANLNVPFQVTNCAVLGFKPKLTTSTSGKTSRKNGTSLAIKITYPAGAQGKEAWFKSAKFDFPKQLPARLTTLQKACLAATFNANPAACPPASKAGTAIVHTPILPGVLTGVVYFVSYGGAQFPEAVIVLQGDNVTVDLHAETFISKTDVTSATLRSIPGVPFENVEVNLPAGPFSEFAAVGDLCASGPKMNTAFTAQNGLTLHQTTKLAVTNCPKHKTAKKKKGKAKPKRK